MKPMWRYRLGWFWKDIKRWWYKVRHGIDINQFSDTMMPDLGKGDYVSVYRKGDFIDVIGESEDFTGHMVRVIPCQHNHGLMIEVWENGDMKARTGCSLNDLASIAGVDWFPNNIKQRLVVTNQAEVSEKIRNDMQELTKWCDMLEEEAKKNEEIQKEISELYKDFKKEQDDRQL